MTTITALISPNEGSESERSRHAARGTTQCHCPRVPLAAEPIGAESNSFAAQEPRSALAYAVRRRSKFSQYGFIHEAVPMPTFGSVCRNWYAARARMRVLLRTTATAGMSAAAVATAKKCLKGQSHGTDPLTYPTRRERASDGFRAPDPARRTPQKSALVSLTDRTAAHR